MSTLIKNAGDGKIYLSPDGHYVFRDHSHNIIEGQLDLNKFNLFNLDEKLRNPKIKNQLKKNILAFLSAEGHMLSSALQEVRNNSILGALLCLSVASAANYDYGPTSLEVKILSILGSIISGSGIGYLVGKSSSGYDLVLMSTLIQNAKHGKIFLSQDGCYMVRDHNDNIIEGQLDLNKFNLFNLDEKLRNPEVKNQLKKAILAVISKEDHILSRDSVPSFRQR